MVDSLELSLRALRALMRASDGGADDQGVAVMVVAGPDPLRPAHVYESAATDVPPALWQTRVHGSRVRGNVIPSIGL